MSIGGGSRQFLLLLFFLSPGLLDRPGLFKSQLFVYDKINVVSARDLSRLTCDVDEGDSPADTPAPAHQTEWDGDQLGQPQQEVDQQAADPVQRVRLPSSQQQWLLLPCYLLSPARAADRSEAPADHQREAAWGINCQLTAGPGV